MLPKVSVVVPIYNVEKYLKQCVDSLLNQTLKDIEIILVDDGAKDGSGKIVDEYKNKFTNVKVIHQANGGLGPARNTGIENATGEYIAFVDGDDWVQSNMYEKLYVAAQKSNSDIVVSGHCDYKNGVPVVTKKHPLAGKTFNSEKDIKKIRKNLFGHYPGENTVEAFPMSVCMSLYKREIIDNFHLRFRNILSEDTIFNINAYNYAKMITFVSYTDYCYRKEEQDSITKSLSSDKRVQFKEFLMTLRDLALKENDLECQIRAKRMAIDYCRFYVGIVEGANLTNKKKKKYISEFAEDKELIQCWKGYPISTLPLQQKLFYILMEHKFYAATLLMTRIRMALKNSELRTLRCDLKIGCMNK